jgi:hypothetical protein
MNGEVLNFVSDAGLEKAIKINPNFPISLHWMNESKTCSLIKKEIKTENSKLNKEYKTLNKQLNQLKTISLWLKVNETIVSLTAYDLYESLFSHLRNGNFEDQLFNAQDVSFISPAGPYKCLSLVECINQDTFEKFLYIKTIQNKLAQRSFRLNTKGKVTSFYGDFFQEKTEVELEQITDTGFLFSSSDETFLELIEDQHQLKFQMDISFLDNYFDNSVEDEFNNDPFHTTNTFNSFTINQSHVSTNLKFDSAITGKFYVFCRFEQINELEYSKSIRKFVKKFKEAI